MMLSYDTQEFAKGRPSLPPITYSNEVGEAQQMLRRAGEERKARYQKIVEANRNNPRKPRVIY